MDSFILLLKDLAKNKVTAYKLDLIRDFDSLIFYDKLCMMASDNVMQRNEKLASDFIENFYSAFICKIDEICACGTLVDYSDETSYPGTSKITVELEEDGFVAIDYYTNIFDEYILLDSTYLFSFSRENEEIATNTETYTKYSLSTALKEIKKLKMSLLKNKNGYVEVSHMILMALRLKLYSLETATDDVIEDVEEDITSHFACDENKEEEIKDCCCTDKQ